MTGEQTAAIAPTVTPNNQGHSARYERWHGELKGGFFAWLVIVTTGIRSVLKNAKTRTLMLTSLSLPIGTVMLLYVFSFLESLTVAEAAHQYRGMYEMIQGLLGIDVSGIQRIGEYRELLWRSAFLLLIKVQMVWVLLIVSRVGPGLIANDIKTRALPIYFAKPITPLTYMLGKWLIVASFIAMVTLIPNLATVVLGTFATGGLETFGATANLAFDLLISGLAMCSVGGAIMLAISSMTSDYRYATAGWIAICLMLSFAQSILYESLPAAKMTEWLGCVSLRDCFLVHTEWLFGMRQAWTTSNLPEQVFSNALVPPVKSGCAITVLLGWMGVSLLVAYRRILKFSRSAANI